MERIAKFKGKDCRADLKVSVHMGGFGPMRGPELTVYNGTEPLLTALVFDYKTNPRLCAWTSLWGIHGNRTDENLTTADICDLMGWQVPA